MNKSDFPIFDTNPELHFLDTAATSQTPSEVLDAVHAYYLAYRASTHRGLYAEAERATTAYENARASVAAFIGVHPDEIVFTSGATASANMLTYALEHTLELSEGDEILVSITEHHSSLVPLQKLAERKNLVLKYVELARELNGELTRELDYDPVASLITERTKLVSVMLASNVLGTIHDVARITDLAHEVRAKVLCDATAAVGHIPVTARELGVDFLYFSGHKMCGPTGIGVLYGARRELGELEPGFYGGGMVDDVSRESASWCTVPARFEAGTPNIAGAIGLGRACAYLDGIGVDKIHEHVRELTAYLQEKLSAIDGVTVFSAVPEHNVGIASFTLEGVHPHDVAAVAASKNVAVRAGHHCALPLHSALSLNSTTRASLYLYNIKEDIDTLALSIEETKRLFSS